MILAFPADNPWATAAVWLAIATLAAFLAIRVGLVAALVEIVLGVLAGNLIGLHANTWIDFVAGFGSVMLAYLAGSEIDPKVLREQLKPALAIGVLSFGTPFVGVLLFALFGAHWTADAAKIAALAMSSTSVAVVYAVMVETRLAATELGQLLLASCFVTGLGTVAGLDLFFADYNLLLGVLVVVVALAMAFASRGLRAVFAATGARVSEPGMRLLFTAILAISALATAAHSGGVLPAYLFGLGCAGFFISHPEISRRVRSTTMSLLTPFYFIKAGTLVAFAAVTALWPLIAAFFLVKLAATMLGVWPMARAFGYGPKNTSYITMMMATGLTFGTIASVYGLAHGLIDGRQYTVLVTAVIVTAVVPTILAQGLFSPLPPSGVPRFRLRSALLRRWRPERSHLP